jgi:subtilisin-like proprotein convertase family protein
LGSLITFSFPTGSAQIVSASIADNGGASSSSLAVTGSGITQIEYVEITVGAAHADWGSFQIDLVRSGGYSTSSRLANSHTCYDAADLPQNAMNCSNSANSFRFGSARHLGEAADGTWTLSIRDMKADGVTGTFNSWQLRIFGS